MTSTSNFAIYSFYKFFPSAAGDLPSLHRRVLEAGASCNIFGLILLAEEGINGTVTGIASELEEFWNTLRQLFPLGDCAPKKSFAKENPFKRLKIKIKDEIVTSELKMSCLEEAGGVFLEPKDWHAMLDSNEEITLLDVRNDYESDLGKFRKACVAKIDKFTQLRDFVSKVKLPKDRKLLMYCTGGIRCEKASLELKELGYRDIYQLKGGILDYLKEFPNQHFEGECFVFDGRVAVDQNLEPSKRYKLCPHCGDPGDLRISCTLCDSERVICEDCQNLGIKTCSQNCEYHYNRTLKRAALSSS